MINEKLPRLGTHFANHGVDAGMFSLNWFLCVFVDNIPVKTYLHIWDSFLFEGSKVRRAADGAEHRLDRRQTQPILVSLGANSLSVATPVVVSDWVDIWVALRFSYH